MPRGGSEIHFGSSAFITKTRSLWNVAFAVADSDILHSHPECGQMLTSSSEYVDIVSAYHAFEDNCYMFGVVLCTLLFGGVFCSLLLSL